MLGRHAEAEFPQRPALAHEIQQGYLPDELEGYPDADFEIFGRVYPARQVAGDFYDFVKGNLYELRAQRKVARGSDPDQDRQLPNG